MIHLLSFRERKAKQMQAKLGKKYSILVSFGKNFEYYHTREWEIDYQTGVLSFVDDKDERHITTLPFHITEYDNPDWKAAS
jgi:hypothetical protein